MANRKFLTRPQVLARMKRGDVPERFENYAAFKSDGAKAKLHDMNLMVAEDLINQAKPSIGAAWSLKAGAA